MTAKRISRQFLRYLRGVLATSKAAIKRNRTMREILYGLSNREIFSDLFWHEKMLSDTQTNWRNVLFRMPRRRVRSGDKLDYTVSRPDLRDFKTWKAELR